MVWKDDGKSFSEGFLEGQYFSILNDVYISLKSKILEGWRKCNLALCPYMQRGMIKVTAGQIGRGNKKKEQSNFTKELNIGNKQRSNMFNTSFNRYKKTPLSKGTPPEKKGGALPDFFGPFPTM